MTDAFLFVDKRWNGAFVEVRIHRNKVHILDELEFTFCHIHELDHGSKALNQALRHVFWKELFTLMTENVEIPVDEPPVTIEVPVIVAEEQ